MRIKSAITPWPGLLMMRLINFAGVFLICWCMSIHGQTPVSVPHSWMLKMSPTRKMAIQDPQLNSLPDDHRDVDRNMQWKTSHLTQACEILRQNHTNNPNNNSYGYLFDEMPVKLIHSERFELIGCRIPKVGSTNIRGLMYTLDHLSRTNNANTMRHKSKSWDIVPEELNSSQMSDLKMKLNTYTKFIVIRDPIERLVSAYRNRRPRYLLKHKTMPFNEWLVKAILNTTKSILNRHVRPFNEWCKPCSMKYDFVGQLNNFDEDMNAILEYVGARNIIILPTREQTNYRKAKSYDVVERYRRTIPKYLLEQIYEKYYLDYFLFGFPRPY